MQKKNNAHPLAVMLDGCALVLEFKKDPIFGVCVYDIGADWENEKYSDF